MKRLFVLGSNPALSTAEILSRFRLPETAVLSLAGDCLVTETDRLPDMAETMAGLGGTVKVGSVLERPVSPETLAEYLGKTGSNRPVFGISQHGLPTNVTKNQSREALKDLIRLGMETKRLLKGAGIPSRFVRPQDGVSLSSVVVEKNRLLGQGAEFVLFGESGLAVTETVQPFEEFSRIDYGRPARNAKQGMLPPKLARIMLNLANVGKKSHIWDPFCGSGTVLTEACRLGAEKAYGSDISPQAVQDTKDNLEWSRSDCPNDRFQAVISEGDARRPCPAVPKGSLDAVISEIFLGVPRQGNENRGELSRQLREITVLTEQAIGNWIPYLKPNAPIVLALPAHVAQDDMMLTEPKPPKGWRWHHLLSPNLAGKTGVPTTDRGGVLYGRKGQLVWREIVRLKKIGGD
ncbi:50S ribosomal protein L11 methyltransferase [Candidatus Uhrbacteria bacterium]|nr:50S ribosomal protein L11 methyltransferase [Candidatus Uhrbacteria bacterium]